LYTPTEAEFQTLAGRGNLIPVIREVPADLETPIGAYLKLADGKPSYLLESVEGGEWLGRYSFIGIDPYLVFRAKGDEVRLEGPGGTEVRRADPVRALRQLMARFRPALPDVELPRFYGGAVGYLAYDLVRFLERLPATTPDDLGLPDCLLCLTHVVVVFDHVRHRMLLVANARVDGEPRAAYRQAVARIEATLARLNAPVAAGAGGPARSGPAGTAPGVPAVVPGGATALASTWPREAYVAAVERAQAAIAAGEVFQVVLSRRSEAPLGAHPVDVYRALRRVNPSPYLFYLDFPEVKLAGSSPETLVRVEDGLVQTRPIAGTRPRGRTPAQDRLLEYELLADAKERAEHVMLVDLSRNDVGRVCRYGSVRVGRLMAVERYSHVMHIVTDVQGELDRGRDALDALFACFPAGTVSGAPKVRAMELIEELEPHRRGPYAGAVGYLGYSGNLDTCITIRTIVMTGGRALVQAGAGIVADSRPQREADECASKAQALFRALELAEQQAAGRQAAAPYPAAAGRGG